MTQPSPSPSCRTIDAAYYTSENLEPMCHRVTPEPGFSSPLAETGAAFPPMTLLAIGLLVFVVGLYVKDRFLP